MTTWHSYWAFALFLPLVFVLGWIFYQRHQRRATFLFSSSQLLTGIHPGIRSYLVKVPHFLKICGLVFGIVAMARPQEANTKIKRHAEGIDIVIALDISDSMLIEDMKPDNRLESSKKTIKEFIQGRISDRIGLVVFSGESYTRVPMTLDYPMLLKSLREVTTTRNIKMGTAIGVALANSVGRLKDSSAKSKVVIFLTDGENNSGTIDPETAIDIAKGYGVKIYSIGMGRDGQAQLPTVYTDSRGNRRKRYRPIHSKINQDLLNKMAQDTGGKYYRASTSEGLQGVFSNIDRLEKTKVEVSEYTKYAELFPPWAYWCLIFYVVASMLSRSVLRRGP